MSTCVSTSVAIGTFVMPTSGTSLDVRTTQGVADNSADPLDPPRDDRLSNILAKAKNRNVEKRLIALGTLGHARAQYDLAMRYGRGDRVQQSWTDAFKWCQLAADHNHADAQNTLGYLYERGLGVSADSRLAARWYQLASNQDHAEASWNLALLYDSGHGVVQSAGAVTRFAQSVRNRHHKEEHDNTPRMRRACCCLVGWMDG
jgi:TPR repeat protein